MATTADGVAQPMDTTTTITTSCSSKPYLNTLASFPMRRRCGPFRIRVLSKFPQNRIHKQKQLLRSMRNCLDCSNQRGNQR